MVQVATARSPSSHRRQVPGWWEPAQELVLEPELVLVPQLTGESELRAGAAAGTVGTVNIGSHSGPA